MMSTTEGQILLIDQIWLQVHIETTHPKNPTRVCIRANSKGIHLRNSTSSPHMSKLSIHSRRHMILCSLEHTRHNIRQYSRTNHSPSDRTHCKRKQNDQRKRQPRSSLVQPCPRFPTCVSTNCMRVVVQMRGSW